MNTQKYECTWTPPTYEQLTEIYDIEYFTLENKYDQKDVDTINALKPGDRYEMKDHIVKCIMETEETEVDEINPDDVSAAADLYDKKIGEQEKSDLISLDSDTINKMSLDEIDTEMAKSEYDQVFTEETWNLLNERQLLLEGQQVDETIAYQSISKLKALMEKHGESEVEKAFNELFGEKIPVVHTIYDTQTGKTIEVDAYQSIVNYLKSKGIETEENMLTISTLEKYQNHVIEYDDNGPEVVTILRIK